MTPTLLRLCADIMLTDDEVVMDFGLPALTDAEVATLNDAIATHTGDGDTHQVRSSQPEVSTWVLVGACAVMLKGWAVERTPPVFKVGDRVRVVRKFEDREPTPQRGGIQWVNFMEETIGKVGTFVEFDPDDDLRVEFEDGMFWLYTPDALEAATPRAHECESQRMLRAA